MSLFNHAVYFIYFVLILSEQKFTESADKKGQTGQSTGTKGKII